MKNIALFDDQGWKEDANYPHQAWQEEVEQENTTLGYGAWLVAQHEADGIVAQLDAAVMIEDEPSAEFLAEHEDEFPVEDWIEEVAELNTRLGYAVWVAHQVEMTA